MKWRNILEVIGTVFIIMMLNSIFYESLGDAYITILAVLIMAAPIAIVIYLLKKYKHRIFKD